MIQKIINIFRVHELRKKLAFTALMLLVFRLGGIVLLPGLERDLVDGFVKSSDYPCNRPRMHHRPHRCSCHLDQSCTARRCAKACYPMHPFHCWVTLELRLHRLQRLELQHTSSVHLTCPIDCLTECWSSSK